MCDLPCQIMYGGGTTEYYFKHLAGIQQQRHSRGWSDVVFKPTIWIHSRNVSICANLSSPSEQPRPATTRRHFCEALPWRTCPSTTQLSTGRSPPLLSQRRRAPRPSSLHRAREMSHAQQLAGSTGTRARGRGSHADGVLGRVGKYEVGCRPSPHISY